MVTSCILNMALVPSSRANQKVRSRENSQVVMTVIKVAQHVGLAWAAALVIMKWDEMSPCVCILKIDSPSFVDGLNGGRERRLIKDETSICLE